MFSLSLTVTLDTHVLDALVSSAPGKIEGIVKKTAFGVEGDAKQLAPVDTGALRNSIHTEMRTPFLAVVMDGVPYGIYQELGTYKMRAQPFMTPAVEMHRDAFYSAFGSLFL